MIPTPGVIGRNQVSQHIARRDAATESFDNGQTMLWVEDVDVDDFVCRKRNDRVGRGLRAGKRRRPRLRLCGHDNQVPSCGAHWAAFGKHDSASTLLR